jgi:hypothetical protein
MNSPKPECEEMKFLVMALVDGELDETEASRVRGHLESCPDCQATFSEQTKVKEVANTMKFKKLPEYYWDEYWQHIYNRIERSAAWIFTSVGAIIVLSFSAWYFVDAILANKELNIYFKAGIFLLAIGLVILGVSTLREKLMVKRIDKYRGIER